ncbi:MAG: Acetylornithine deacetylase/Succinyl-diaminopimelate desuccinylase and related deacylases, partial [uncultured Chloroflexia bacterium]
YSYRRRSLWQADGRHAYGRRQQPGLCVCRTAWYPGRQPRGRLLGHPGAFARRARAPAGFPERRAPDRPHHRRLRRPV